MKAVVLMLCLMLPTLAFGQSLGEVAKKEKERRDRNKEEGKKVLVISEEELFPEEDEDAASGEGDETGVEGPSSGTAGPRRPSTEEREREEYDEEADYADETEDVPTFIPPDAPLEERMLIFEKMKRGYERKVQEIDESIAENEERLRELEDEIAETSALGGAGLPVAPRTGTGAATRQMTGQESEQLVAEKNRLLEMNESLRQRKDQLKLDLQAKGRAAGIPPGYLRF